VEVKIYSRGYEAKKKAEEDARKADEARKAEEARKEAERAARAAAYSQMQSSLGVPGLPGIDLGAMQLRDISGSFNTPRPNGSVETPMFVPDTRFRDRFDRITFGIDPLGSGEVQDSEEATQEQESGQSAPTATPSNAPNQGQGGTHRARRPVSPAEYMRGIENGISRLSTPLLDALENIDVQRAVSEARNAGETFRSYYNSAQSATPSHDAALRDWDNTPNLPGGTTSGSNSREQFNSMRLK
jgi:hypothetical protein